VKWFKVTLLGDKIKSCEEVPSRDSQGREVRFVEAESADGARAIVLAWQRERDRVRAANRKVYERSVDSGMCGRCHKLPVVEGRRSCEGCLAFQRKYMADRESGARKPLERTDDEKVALFVGRRERSKGKWKERYGSSYEHAQKVTRRNVLAECLRQLEMLTVPAFRVWLAEEVERAREARPPAKHDPASVRDPSLPHLSVGHPKSSGPTVWQDAAE